MKTDMLKLNASVYTDNFLEKYQTVKYVSISCSLSCLMQGEFLFYLLDGIAVHENILNRFIFLFLCVDVVYLALPLG